MKRKKKPITLLEIMLVILLIGLISGVIAYNMSGTLERGKVFKTKQAISQLHDLLLLAVEDGAKIDQVAKNPEEYLKALGLAKDPDKLLTDGWGKKLKIKVINSGTDFEITSDNL